MLQASDYINKCSYYILQKTVMKKVVTLLILVTFCRSALNQFDEFVQMHEELEFDLGKGLSKISDVASKAQQVAQKVQEGTQKAGEIAQKAAKLADPSALMKLACSKGEQALKLAATKLSKMTKILDLQGIIQQNLAKIKEMVSSLKNVVSTIKQMKFTQDAAGREEQQATLVQLTSTVQNQLQQFDIANIQQILQGINLDSIQQVISNIQNSFQNATSMLGQVTKVAEKLTVVETSINKFMDTIKNFKITPEDIKSKLTTVTDAIKECFGDSFKPDQDDAEESEEESEEEEPAEAKQAQTPAPPPRGANKAPQPAAKAAKDSTPPPRKQEKQTKAVQKKALDASPPPPKLAKEPSAKKAQGTTPPPGKFEKQAKAAPPRVNNGGESKEQTTTKKVAEKLASKQLPSAKQAGPPASKQASTVPNTAAGKIFKSFSNSIDLDNEDDAILSVSIYEGINVITNEKEQTEAKFIEPTEFQVPKHRAVKQEEQKKVQQMNTKLLESKIDGDPAYQFELEDKSLQDTDEYGYGFWLKTIGNQQRKPGDQHFISRLTSNKEFQDNQLYGDRSLLVYLKQNSFIFSTYDIIQRVKSKDAEIAIDGSIDDTWFFISFSYSAKQKRAVGFIMRYGQPDRIQRLVLECVHQPPKYLKLLIGGKQLSYFGFDGKFANVFYDFDAPAFVDSIDDVKQIISKVSQIPQALIYEETISLVALPKAFDDLKATYEMPQFKSEFVIESYSLCGWFRWFKEGAISEQTTFQIVNLRSNAEKTNNGKGVLGDRELEVHYTAGGGAESNLLFNTYTLNGNGGKGLAFLTKSIPSNVALWSYFYIAYDTSKSSAYGASIRPGFNSEVLFKEILHKQPSGLYVTVGGDKVTSSFQGKLAYLSLTLGPNSYREGLLFGDSFQYGEGAIGLFKLGSPLETAEPKVKEATADQAEVIIDKIFVHDDKDTKINGQSEYAFGLWTRWLTTLPKQLKQKQPSYNIARFGTDPNELDKDLKRVKQRALTLKDQTLMVQLEPDAYEFSTYKEKEIAEELVKYGTKLEGFWNYIYFGYKRTGLKGLAKGFVQFGESEDVQEVSIQTLHDFILTYAEFQIAKNEAPLFNGYFANIVCSIGPGAFIESKEKLILLVKNTLPEIAKPKFSGRQTVTISTGKQSYPNTEDTAKEITNCQGASEYSVSGWVKWDGEKITGRKANLLQLAQRKLEEIEGPPSLGIQRTDQNLLFATYTCEEGNCGKLVSTEEAFEENWDQWIFIYFGYSQAKKKAFGFIKYKFGNAKFDLNEVKHFYVAVMSINLGLKFDKLTAWNGHMKSWVVNLGDGSYKEEGYEIGEKVEQNFGFSSGTDHYKQEASSQEAHQHEKIVESSTAQKDHIPLHVEFKESDKLHLNGVSEYGYGYWMRFQYFSKLNSIYVQPQWMGISRLTCNKEYKDFEQPGDRVLTVLLGKSSYQFSTYGAKQNLLTAEIAFKLDIEGEWVYLYTAYKRLSDTKGIVQGYLYLNDQVAGVEIEALHTPLSNYLQLTLGHAGKYYPNLNGQLTKIRVNLGEGAYLSGKEKFLERIKVKDTKPEVANDSRNLEVLNGKFEVSQMKQENPTVVEQEAREYSVALWFRWARFSQNQIVYRLTSTPLETLEDNNKVGDRTLALTHTKNVHFSTYDLADRDGKEWKDEYLCEVPLAQQTVWTFTYFAYSKQEKKVSYYLKAEDYICKGNEAALHVVASKFWLYLGKDQKLNNFEGRLAEVDLTFGPKSYRTDEFLNLPSYLLSAKVFPPEFKFVWESDRDVLLTLDTQYKVKFESTEDKPFEMVTQYAVGFWSRLTITQPKRILRLPVEMQLMRLSCNEQVQDGKIAMGDRVLSAFITAGKYQFGTYDMNDNAPNEISEIKIDNFEGEWHYIYLGYSRVKQVARYYHYDGKQDKVSQAQNENLLHVPLEDVIHLIFGGEHSFKSFQGRLSEIAVQFGPGAYVAEPELLKKVIESSFSLAPELLVSTIHKTKKGELKLLEGVEISKTIEQGGDTWASSGEYSISGWFKQSQSSGKSTENNCQLLFRVTNNEKEQLGDKKTQGDRALYAAICNNQEQLLVSTYTLVGLQDWNELRQADAREDFGPSRKAWSYIYMGYNEVTREVNVFLHLFDSNKPIIFKNVLHFVPNYIGVYLGKDPHTEQFSGFLQQWVARYGVGAFVSVAEVDNLPKLPNIQLIQSNRPSQWIDKEEQVRGSSIQEEFSDQAESISEYAVGVWTRWLYAFPSTLMKSSEFYHIFRLSSTKELKDKVEIGNRLLMVLLGSNHYQFSTNDAEKNLPSVESKISYIEVEGEWNYVYAAYKDKQMFGAIVSRRRDYKSEDFKVEVKHTVLTGYAKIGFLQKEFDYEPFHGWIFDPKVWFGQGAFIGDGGKLSEAIQKLPRKIPVANQDSEDFKWPVNLIDTTIEGEVEKIKDKLTYTFDKQAQIEEYACGAWIQIAVLTSGEQDLVRTVARLSTNPQEKVNEKEQLGDRALQILTTSKEVTFNSYRLKGLGFESVSKGLSILEYQWTYVYFGYSPKKSVAYVLTTKEPTLATLELSHIVPNKLYLSMLRDQYQREFDGKMFGFSLFFGSGSVVEDPAKLIDKWPYQQKKAAQPIQLQMNKRK